MQHTATQHRARRLGGAVHRRSVADGTHCQGLPGPCWACLSGPLPVHSWLARRARPPLPPPPPPAFWSLALCAQLPVTSQSPRAPSARSQAPLSRRRQRWPLRFARPPSLSSFQSVPQKQTSPHTPTRIPLLTNTTPPPATFPREPKRTSSFLFLLYPLTQLPLLLFIFATLSRYVSPQHTPCSASYTPALARRGCITPPYPQLPASLGLLSCRRHPAPAAIIAHFWHCEYT